MAVRSGTRRFPQRILAVEHGRWFSDWTVRTAGSAVMDGGLVADYPAGALISFKNNNGAGSAMADFRLPYADLQLETDATYEDAHTVATRVTESNLATQGFALGPATCCVAGSGTGDCYCAVAVDVGGVRVVGLVKVAAGFPTTLASAVFAVDAGDILYLSYRWDIGDGSAKLAVAVNTWADGALITHTDSSSPYRMSATVSTLGLYGSILPSIPNTYDVGHVVNEWWALWGWQQAEEPESQTEAVKGFRVNILKRQRYTSDPTPVIHRMMSGEIVRATWSTKRMGGCSSLRAEINYPEVEGTGAESQFGPTFDDPKATDWETGDWLGGEVTVDIHWQLNRLQVFTLTAGEIPQTQDTVWRGLVTSIKWDPDTKVIKVAAAGLVKQLDHLFYTGTFTAMTIRDIITTVMSDRAKTVEPAPKSLLSQDSNYRFDAAKIVGVQSAFDIILTLDFQRESLTGILQKLFAFFPPGAVWGIDKDGDFYVDQQLDHYTADLSSAGIQHFVVDNQAVKFTKSTDVRQIRTQCVVAGGDPQPISLSVLPRVIAIASSGRARQLWGFRDYNVLDDAIKDQGLAQKVASAQLKSRLLPAISADLEITTPIRGNRELWQATVRGAPRVAVDDRINNSTSYAFGSELGPEAIITTEYLLRRFGDNPATAIDELGSAGASMYLASVSVERNLDTSWFIHQTLRFSRAHPGSTGDRAFVFGRRDAAAAATDGGWGCLVWFKDTASTSKLQWAYTKNGGGSVTYLDLGITPTVGGSSTIYHLTIWRDASGKFWFYNGNTNTGSSAQPNDVLDFNDTGDWRWFDDGGSTPPANWIAGDFECEQFWVFDATNIETNNSTGVVGFIATMNDRALSRQWCEGMLLYAPMDEQFSTVNVNIYFHRGNYAGGSDLNAVVAVGTLIVSLSGGNTTVMTTGAVRGIKVGTGAFEKKWGGPLVFDSHTTTYSFDGGTGLLRRRFKLGRLPTDVFSTIALLQEEIRLSEEARQRNNPS